MRTLPGEEFTKEGEAIPSQGGEATGDRKGLQKMRLSIKPTENLKHKLALLRERLIDTKETTTSERSARVDETQHLIML